MDASQLGGRRRTAGCVGAHEVGDPVWMHTSRAGGIAPWVVLGCMRLEVLFGCIAVGRRWEPWGYSGSSWVTRGSCSGGCDRHEMEAQVTFESD